MDKIEPMNVLIIDAYNMIHRCRFNWGGGVAESDNQIFYNFVKLIKSTVEQFTPDKVYFVLDGKPSARLDAMPSYKANRIREDNTQEEIDYWDNFSRQKNLIINFVDSNLPVTCVLHPNMECDDIIFNIAKYVHNNDKVTIVSNDSDFIQALNKLPNSVKLWNPIRKVYLENTEYDYVSWKSMVGDRSDNIPGVKGIGKKTASKILSTDGLLSEKLLDDKFRKQYNSCYKLIEFIDLNDDWSEVDFGDSKFEQESAKNSFHDLEFKSLVKDSYWENFKNIFINLEGV